jgi:hypothetical protein
MKTAERPGFPTVEELIAAANSGDLDDRVERYLPDSTYTRRALADSTRARNAPKQRAAPRSAQATNGRRLKRTHAKPPLSPRARGAPAGPDDE